MTKKLTAKAPEGYKGQLIAKITTEGGYFSVTGEISTPFQRKRGDFQCGGCIHDEILAAFPQLAPLVALHLSDAETGEPMHAEANGFYWLAGCDPEIGSGVEYHGGTGSDARTPEECFRILREHMRIPEEYARDMVADVAASDDPPATFAKHVAYWRGPWKEDAEEGHKLIASL
jgi:hypothetical protein